MMEKIAANQDRNRKDNVDGAQWNIDPSQYDIIQVGLNPLTKECDWNHQQSNADNGGAIKK